MLESQGNTRFTNKKSGNGLGIFEAKRKIKEWGGDLEIRKKSVLIHIKIQEQH